MRNLPIGLVASVLFLVWDGAVAQDNATQDQLHVDVLGEEFDEIRVDFVPLVTDQLSGTVRRMAVISDNQLYLADLTGRTTRRNENRLPLDSIPILGDLTRHAYTSDQFTSQFAAGVAGLLDQTLVIHFDPASSMVTELLLDPALLTTLRDFAANGVVPAPPQDAGSRTGQQGALQANAQLVLLHGVFSYSVAMPALQPTCVTTTVTVPEGSTLVLGGIFCDDSQPASTSPLSGIPVIGRLFRGFNTTSQSNELMILVTPTITIQEDE